MKISLLEIETACIWISTALLKLLSLKPDPAKGLVSATLLTLSRSFEDVKFCKHEKSSQYLMLQTTFFFLHRISLRKRGSMKPLTHSRSTFKRKLLYHLYTFLKSYYWVYQQLLLAQNTRSQKTERIQVGFPSLSNSSDF